MLGKLKAGIYSGLNGAKQDAEALCEVLGNKEKVNKVVTDRAISKGKWNLVFDELYKMVEKKDAHVLKDAYFDIVKRGDYEVLWEGFPHFESEREKHRLEMLDSTKEGAIDRFIIESQEVGMEFDELFERFKARWDKYQQPIAKPQPIETTQEQPKVTLEKPEEPVTAQPEQMETQQTTSLEETKQPTSIEEIDTVEVNDLEQDNDFQNEILAALEEKPEEVPQDTKETVVKVEKEIVPEEKKKAVENDPYLASLINATPPEEREEEAAYVMGNL